MLGTPTYMSPEQARGRPVDKRTDVWAFGCVLYECLTGRRPFAGDSLTDVLAAIVEREPDWGALPGRTTPRVRELLRRCLEKDARERLRDVGEARVALSRAGADAPVDEGSSSVSRWPWMLATAVLALALVAAVFRGDRVKEERSTRIPRGGILAQMDPSAGGTLAITPDGLHVVYSTGSVGGELILHSLATFETRRIEGVANAVFPFFSDDGRSLAYFDTHAKGLFTLPLGGGSPRQVLESYNSMPALWLPDGSFLLAGVNIDGRTWRGLARVDADGTNVRKVTTARSDGEIHASPLVLPGGRWIVFTVVASGYDTGIVAFEGGEHELLDLGTTPHFVEPDILLTYDPPSRRVEAVHMDPESGELLGDPWVVLPNVDRGREGLGAYAVGADGTLVYVPADPGAASFLGNELVWFDGETVEPIGRGDLDRWTQPRLSPDETRLLVRRTGTPDCSLWLFDLERASKTRLTLELDTHSPLWHPDGEHVLFSAEPEDGITQIMIQAADGSSPAAPLRTGVTQAEIPASVSVEGELLAFTRVSGETGTDVWVVPLAGGEPEPFAVTRFEEQDPSFSPDGRWIAYTSDETGAEEVYVRAWPSGGARTQVSVEGGTSPRFSRDGKRLFFAIGADVWVADLEAGETFRASLPRPAFQGDFVFERVGNWDVSRDGSRAVFVRGTREAANRPELRVVYDWTDSLVDR